MITTNPFLQLLVEKNIKLEALSQLTGISMSDLSALKKGRKVTKHNIEAICQVLNCQPSDIIEFTKSETKGHWEWVDGE